MISRYEDQFAPAFARFDGEHDLFWIVPLRMRYMLVVAGPPYSARSAVVRHLRRQAFDDYDAATRSSARQLLRDIRVEQLAARRESEPAPRLVVSGVSRAEDLALLTSMRRCAVVHLAVDDAVRVERARCEGTLTMDRRKDLRKLSVADLGPATAAESADIGTGCPQRSLSLAHEEYLRDGLAPVLDALDAFVGELDDRYPAAGA